MSEWKEYNLGEIFEFASGLSKPASEFGFGFPFLTFKDVFNNYFLPDELSGLVNSTEYERTSCSINRGDVFLTRTSETDEELGMSSVALKDYPNATFNGFTKRLRPKENNPILPEYAGFYFRSPNFRATVTSMASVTTRASLNNSMLEMLSIAAPKKEEQKVIAKVLSSLDAKIDLLHRQNRTLEAMAKTLFRRWFMEEADGSWEEGELGNYLEIVYGKNLPTSKLLSNGFPVYGGNGQIGFYAAYLYDLPQVLVSCRGEASGTVNISLPKSFVTNNSLVLEINKNNYVTFEYLKYFSLFTDYKSYVTGSAQPQITIESLKRAKFVLPPRYLIDKFSDITKNLEAKRSKNQIQIKTLENLRNILLPKLMSGEIKVAL